MGATSWLGKRRGSNSLPFAVDGLVNKLSVDYPGLRFLNGQRFAFRPPRTVVIGPDEPSKELLLLHEVGHALLGHREFATDVSRLKMEVGAWEKAREIASQYGVEFDDEVMEQELETYRNWLHQKSRCPRCGLIRYQIPNGEYKCPKCDDLE